MVGGRPRDEPLCYFLCGTESSAHNKVCLIKNCIYSDSAKYNKAKAKKHLFATFCAGQKVVHIIK